MVEIKEEVPAEESLKIELVHKTEVIKNNKQKFIDSDVDIKSSDEVKNMVETPTKSNYIDTSDEALPDLLLNNSLNENWDVASFEIPDNGEFEQSLETLMPEIDDFLVEETADEYSISWDGEVREFIGTRNIDFSSFPEQSFTGVGVQVEFMVNLKGKVYGVNVIEPGSGSIEFDILITQYVSKFTFDTGDIISRGEVFIVYKK